MLDNKSLVILTICINYVYTEYKIYSDGWIPVPHDQIYNQIWRQADHNVFYPHLETTIKKLESNKVSQSQLNLNENDQEHENANKLNNLNKNIRSQINLGYEVYEDISNNTNVAESSRRAKAVVYPVLVNNVDAFVDKQINKEDIMEDKIAYIRSKMFDKTISYEVSEDTDDIKDIKQDSSNEGTVYERTSAITDNQNLNSKLINILSKYNIKDDDILNNYDISRLNRAQKPMRKFQYKYNNLNHLPVDPLLAVFLSNYGFYIPSLYGINTHYNNLYGYLASNNIHNNRPFGLYKVFSDTDSWN